jgi:hypothetical protein
MPSNSHPSRSRRDFSERINRIGVLAIISYKNYRRSGLKYRLSSLSEKYNNYIRRGYQYDIENPIEEIDRIL